MHSRSQRVQQNCIFWGLKMANKYCFQNFYIKMNNNRDHLVGRLTTMSLKLSVFSGICGCKSKRAKTYCDTSSNAFSATLETLLNQFGQLWYIFLDRYICLFDKFVVFSFWACASRFTFLGSYMLKDIQIPATTDRPMGLRLETKVNKLVRWKLFFNICVR